MSVKPWRRLYHFLAGVIIALSYYFGDDGKLMLIGLGISAIISFLIECIRFKYHKVNRWLVKRFSMLIKSEEEFSVTGQTFLVIGSFFTILFFKKHIAITSLAFLAVGDVAGATTGKLIGRTKLPITKLTRGKTLEGTVACFLACLCIGLLFRLMLSDLQTEVILIGAVTATLMELLSILPDDNLTVPLGTGIIMSVFDAL